MSNLRSYSLGKRIGFYIAYPFLMGASLLPFHVLYKISDLLYYLLYYVLRYRRNLVLINLQRSFPHKTRKELLSLRHAFFRYLADTIVETIKTFTVPHAKLAARFALPDLEVVETDLRDGKNVMIILGHYGNWEWGAGALGRFTHFPVTAPYTPLRHKGFNDLMVKTRERYGIHLLPKKKLIPFLTENSGKQHYLALIADQSPNPKKYHLITFMNQETAVVKGMETIARDFGFTVYFASIRYLRRGYYEAGFEKICDNAATLQDGELTHTFMSKLERDIIADPVHYLWSHNRWKLTTNKRIKS